MWSIVNIWGPRKYFDSRCVFIRNLYFIVRLFRHLYFRFDPEGLSLHIISSLYVDLSTPLVFVPLSTPLGQV